MTTLPQIVHAQKALSLSIPFNTFDKGPLRYLLCNAFRVEIEETTLADKVTGVANYDSGKQALLPVNLMGDYSYDSVFTSALRGLVDTLVENDVDAAIIDFMAGREGTKSSITITENAQGRYSHQIKVDLTAYQQ